MKEMQHSIHDYPFSVRLCTEPVHERCPGAPESVFCKLLANDAAAQREVHLEVFIRGIGPDVLDSVDSHQRDHCSKQQSQKRCLSVFRKNEQVADVELLLFTPERETYRADDLRVLQEEYVLAVCVTEDIAVFSVLNTELIAKNPSTKLTQSRVIRNNTHP
jgi:hypothetical protein